MTNPIIAFRNVSKVFEDSGTQVLKDINFELEEGKFYTLLGASGSGKSTILNIIAGLLDATSGDVLLDGKRINDIPINKRDVHTVFQSYALFPHMNVFDNVAFALKLKRCQKGNRRACRRSLKDGSTKWLSKALNSKIIRWSTSTCGHCPCDY